VDGQQARPTQLHNVDRSSVIPWRAKICDCRYNVHPFRETHRPGVDKSAHAENLRQGCQAGCAGRRAAAHHRGRPQRLTAEERNTFLRAAERADRPMRTLCMTLAYSGCRLSEALALTADRIDLAAGALVFESLKKRRPGIYCSVPVPPALLEALNLVHGIRELQASRGKAVASGSTIPGHG
jgi:integrase